MFFDCNFYILSQSLVFVNNFFHFFISYSLALLVLTAAQEISYQMFRQMSTIIYNFFYTPLLHTFLHNTAHAYARAVSINCMVSSAVVRHLQTVPASIIYLKVSPQPEFRQPEFHRMKIRSPLQPPPAQPGTRTGMLPQEARPDTQAG